MNTPDLQHVWMWVAIGVLVFLFAVGLRIAREYERGVIFRLGRFAGIRGPGLYWIIPLGIERSIIIDIRVRTVRLSSRKPSRAIV
jgi:regulator of protease activity HflC (stomatin/prohibitin superfamily)